MYPFGRLIWQMCVVARQPGLGNWDTHVSQHYCMPWDIRILGRWTLGGC